MIWRFPPEAEVEALAPPEGAREGAPAAAAPLQRAPAPAGHPKDEPRGVYFQDRRRQYAFACAGAGIELLSRLARASVPLLKLNAEMIAECAHAEGRSMESVREEGERLYADKPNLKKHGGGTWSNAEYGHPGLQGIYLRLKSMQRFTEAWALCERAASQRLFAPAQLEQECVRVVSIGGGPGFELLAFDYFWRLLRTAHEERKAALAKRAAERAKTSSPAPPPLTAGKAQTSTTSWADVSSDEEDEGSDPAMLSGYKCRPETPPYWWLRRAGTNADAPAGGEADGGAHGGKPCRLELVSMDLQPGWGGYVQALSDHTRTLSAGGVSSQYAFVQGDLTHTLRGGGLRKQVASAFGGDVGGKPAAGREGRGGKPPSGARLPPVDYAIISNVLIYCSDEPTADMLASVLLREGVRAVLVSERGTEQRMVEMLQARGVTVRRLMAQDVGRDDRQLIFEPGKAVQGGPPADPATSGYSWDLGTAFPNVPYEERKEALRKEGREVAGPAR